MISRAGKPDTPSDITIREYLDSVPPISFNMVAGAGSGKTTSLVKGLQHIKDAHGNVLQQNSQRVACITYTEIATNEIWKDVGNDPLFHVSTIHSFLWELISPFQRDIQKWVLNKISVTIDDLVEKQANYGPRVQQKTKDKDSQALARHKVMLSKVPQVVKFAYGTGSDYVNGILGHADILRLGPVLINEKPLFRSIVARKYPFFFVDESQDTVVDFIEALRKVHQQEANHFCLGFFGDPQQKIYMTGIGNITPEPTWEKISKPENFRSPPSVLSVINNIRASADDLVQVTGHKDSTNRPKGSAQIIVLPADENRSQYLHQVRIWLAKELEDPQWLNDCLEADVKVLVIVHRMAAKRLGFTDLYSAFNDRAPVSFSTGFTEDSHWSLKPFRHYLLPLIDAFKRGDDFSVMQLLKQHCPHLSKEYVAAHTDKPKLLATIKENLEKLAELLHSDSETSIRKVLQFASETGLVDLDKRFSSNPQAEDDDKAEMENCQSALEAYYECPAQQLWGYHAYMSDESPYDTHQGIKGAEFQRVLVVLDDEEGSAHKLFSYEKLLGIKDLTATDRKNQANNLDSAVERTRRLFYVCCSRALKDLAVVLFVKDVDEAVSKIKASKIFDENAIYSINELNNIAF